MSPTLEGGQYLLVNKLVYLRVDQERLSRIIPFWEVDAANESFAIHPPRRGEVIVFRYPRDPSRDFVKRVIGVPGDSVEIVEGTVLVNGREVAEPYLTSHDKGSMAEVRLGPDEYFVMGDNRRGSNDSRNWGPVPEENILGKVWLIYWPTAKWGILP